MLKITLSVSFYKKYSRIYNSYILEYIWIDGRGNLRSKYRTAYPKFESYAGMGSDNYIPVEHWNYDGFKASTDNTDITLVPVAHYANPFFEPGRAFLILCDAHRDDGAPTETSFRCDAEKVFESGGRQADPWFSIEQKYFIMQPGAEVVNFAQDDEESQHYCCGVGTHITTLRRLAEKHYEYCLRAGLKISGINAEVAPSQWEFQIGPCSCISAGDELWVARYILHKLSEEFGVCISFQPKPVPVPPSTLNTKFSTEDSRNKNGLKCIYKYIDRLSKTDRGASASIRIPNSVLKAGCGYLEDRRPASDADPYQVIAAIFSTACC